jgi:hypothetical protein
LTDFYLSKCFGSNRTYDAQRIIFRDVVRLYDLRQTGFEMDGLKCLYPELLFLGTPSGEYQSCIIHGDLNTRNLFISQSGQSHDVTLIDFSETGRGHVFYDFIVFEANLRMDMSTPINVDLMDLVIQERMLNEGKECQLPYSPHVLRLRRFALENFPSERKDSYLYGLATFCFSLLNAAGLSPNQVKILSSCICAATVHLQRLGFWSR